MTNESLDWDIILENSQTFQNNHPYPYGFVKNPINKEAPINIQNICEVWFKIKKIIKLNIKVPSMAFK